MQLSNQALEWLADRFSSASLASRVLAPNLGERLSKDEEQNCVKTGGRFARLVLGVAISFSLWGGDVGTASAVLNAPTIDDSMSLLAQLSGRNCSVTADLGLYDKQSGVFELNIPGSPVSAYLVWSGRDQENRGDDVVLLNGQPLIADIQHHGESGGGSWWHTYTHDVSTIVQALAPDGGPVTLTLSGLTIGNNLGGENHGAGLVVLYASDQCDENEIVFFSGLDSFKRTAPAAIYGPHSAVHCASVGASQEARRLDLQLQLGGIEGAERNATVWLMTSTEAVPPTSLIGREEALSFFDPVGNDPDKRQWDRFFASIELPSERTQACVQIESGEPEGISAVLVTFMAQVHGAGMTAGGGGSIAGRVWLDANQDGVAGEDELGVPNMVILLRNAAERTIYQAFVTGSSGDYRFEGLAEGDYTIDVADELFTADWLQTGESDGVLDTEVVVPIGPETAEEGVNFGFFPIAPSGLISGTVWSDSNANSIFDAGVDSHIAGVSVSLFDGEQSLVEVQPTDASGVFTFTELSFSNYTVQVDPTTLPDGSIQTFETDATLDGLVTVGLTTLEPSGSVSFGYGERGHASGRVWHDQNSDGLQSTDEPGLDNVLLLLTDELGAGRVAATQNGGQYQFDNLPVGTYDLRVVKESMAVGVTPTFDVDGALDFQTSFTVGESTLLTNIDFGFGFGVRGLEAASPQIDLSITGIDLNDSEALLDYLMVMLEQGAANDGETPPQDEQPEVPTGDEEPLPTTPSEGDPDLGGEHEQIDGDSENGDNNDVDDVLESAFEVHLPVIQ